MSRLRNHNVRYGQLWVIRCSIREVDAELETLLDEAEAVYSLARVFPPAIKVEPISEEQARDMLEVACATPSSGVADEKNEP